MPTLAATRPARKPRSKPARSVQVLQRPGDQGDGRLLVTEGKASDVYFVAEQPTQVPGRAWRVTKFGAAPGEGYDVLVGADPFHSTCSCPGHCYTGRCRHGEALTALVNAGRI